MSIYRLHDTAGEDLGTLEHPAPNLEPGDVVVLWETDPSLAGHLRIEERELKAGGLNLAVAEAEGPFQASIDR